MIIYIARDGNGKLFGYTGKPKKLRKIGMWLPDDSKIDLFSLPMNMLPSVKWEDEEPTKIKFKNKRQ